MFSEEIIRHTEEINQKKPQGRLEELLTQYEEPTKAIVHRVLEEYVEKSFNEFMGNRVGLEFERESDRRVIRDYRNGKREVQQAVIDSLVLENFRVPRNRAGGFKSEIFNKAKRRAGKFSKLALELFVNGVSTRKVRRAFERSGMKMSGLSKSTVSAISKNLIQEYLAWINRPIRDKYDYLQTDGVYLTARKTRPYKAGTMIIIGIRSDGHKEVLHFTLGNESTRNFEEMLQNLIRRGFDMDAVKLVTTDGAKGPIQAIDKHFGRKKLQRCFVHKTRNILEKAPRVLKDELKVKLGRLWYQSSKLEAQEYARRLYDEYKDSAKKSMDCLFEDIEELLRFYDFPEPHRKTISNTNLIERVIREVRRRTKVMDSLDNEYGCYGILMGIVREQNERWSYKSHWKIK